MREFLMQLYLEHGERGFKYDFEMEQAWNLKFIYYDLTVKGEWLVCLTHDAIEYIKNLDNA